MMVEKKIIRSDEVIVDDTGEQISESPYIPGRLYDTKQRAPLIDSGCTYHQISKNVILFDRWRRPSISHQSPAEFGSSKCRDDVACLFRGY